MKKLWGTIILLMLIAVTLPLLYHLFRHQEAFTPNNFVRTHVTTAAER